MHDDDEIELAHDKILRRYGWAEGEREQQMAEMAERQRQIERQALVQEAEPRETVPPNDNIMKRNKAAQAREDHSREWHAYIAGEINRVSKSWIEASMAAVGEMLIEERKRAEEQRTQLRGEFELEVAKLRAEIEVWQKMAASLQPPATEVAAPKRKRVSLETTSEQRASASASVRRRQALS